MFGKKILGLVALLFLGRKVSGTALFDCPNITNNCDDGVGVISESSKYCLSGGKIYRFEQGSNPAAGRRRDAGACLRKQQITNAGSYVFEDDGTGGKLVTLGSDSDYIVTDKDDLKIYNCNTGGETCTQTYGYASIGDTYYSIPKNSITLCSEVTLFANDCASANPDQDKYCLKADGKLYSYGIGDDDSDGTNDCVKKQPLSEVGVFVFQDDGTNSGATLVNLGEATSKVTEQNNLMLYQCSTGSENELKCIRTYGYIKDYEASRNDDYYAISADGTVTKYANGEGLEDNCNIEAKTGKLQTSKKLCLFGKSDSPLESAVITNVGTYIMNNIAKNVFTNGLGTADGSNEKSVVVQSDGKVLFLVSDDYDYCFDTNNVATPTFEEFCNNDSKSCPKLAECSSSLCKRDGGNDSSVTPTCSIVIGGSSSDCEENGYYLITGVTDNTYAPSDAGSGETYLAQCESATSCHAITEANMKVGYYKYAGKDNKYIKCSGYHACSVVDVTQKTDCTQASAVGDIIDFNSSGTEVLCLDKNTATGITLGSEAEYFAGRVDADNIFNSDTDGKFVKVIVDTNSIVLSDKLASDTVTYAYTDTNFKSYARASGAFQPAAICAASTTIIEFKHTTGDCPSSDCSENTAYYEKHVVYQWPADRT